MIKDKVDKYLNEDWITKLSDAEIKETIKVMKNSGREYKDLVSRLKTELTKRNK